MIYPSIRAVTVSYEELKLLTVKYYLDRKPQDSDYENLSEVTTEILADIAFEQVAEQCIYAPAWLSLNDEITVYRRQEN